MAIVRVLEAFPYYDHWNKKNLEIALGDYKLKLAIVKNDISAAKSEIYYLSIDGQPVFGPIAMGTLIELARDGFIEIIEEGQEKEVTRE